VPEKPKKFEEWRKSHQPFHWFVEFYGIMARGGFDVVVGNPPWKEYAAVRNEYTVLNYATEPCGNLHGLCTERALAIRRNDGGRASFIVQLPLTCSSRMSSVRKLLLDKSELLHVISFDDRPGKLFDGLQHCRSVIFLSSSTRSNSHQKYTTRYQRWNTEVRQNLFPQIEFANATGVPLYKELFPKYASKTEVQIFNRLASQAMSSIGIQSTGLDTRWFIFYQEAMQYWAKATTGLPYYSKDGEVGAPAHGRYVHFNKPHQAAAACAIINSSLFYAYFIAYGDCFHLSDGLVTNFPIPETLLNDEPLAALGKALNKSLTENAVKKVINTRDGSEIKYAEFFASGSKPILDEIDILLAKHYGFTPEELDFIINYDIKYRMGRDADAGDE
jgi:hypothetical protein